MRTLVILGPNKTYKSGVLDYSKLIHKILSARNNDFATKIICPTEIHQYKEILQKPDTLLLVQVGANDAQVLRSLQIIKKINPKIKRVLEIHDPSIIVISTHQILDNAKRLFPRILRKIFHKLFIKKMINKLIIKSDFIICKSNFGKLILQKKLR